MDIPPGFLVAGTTGIVTWIAWVHGRVNAHEEVIKKMDQLVSLLLTDRLRERDHD